VILRLKLVLIVAAVAAFTVAMRDGMEWLRWVSIGLMVVAFLLRFLKPR
jgi:hypothetical protein